MFSHKFKNTIWLSCGICFLSSFPRFAYSYEYSVRDAFCSDYASNRGNIYSPTFQYDMQNDYNYCMKNAESLIRNLEEKKELQRQKDAEGTKKYLEEQRLKKEEQRLKKIEKKRQEEIRQRKIQDMVDNADELFF